MSFAEAVRSVAGRYGDFDGVAGRSEFWWWVLANLLMLGALALFEIVPIGETVSLGALLSGLWGVTVLLPTLAAGVRRLRDAGHRWSALPWLLVPVVGVVLLVVLWTRPSRGSHAETPAARRGAASW